MADPLSVAGSVAGLVSLSIQVTGSIVKFYDSYKGQDVAVDRTTGKLKSFLSMLQYLHQRIQERKFQPDEKDLIQAIESSIENCGDLIYELQDECEKFRKKAPAGDLKAAIKATGRRVSYPFKESTLKKLDEDIGEMRENLTFALNALQIEENRNHREDIADVKLVLDLVRANQISSTIRDWLKAPDATINHNSAVAKCHSGTGMWLVRSTKFETWLTGASSLLWLNGFAGSGKSVLCSTAIQYTYRKKQAIPGVVGIAFFYFTFNDEAKKDAAGMLRALLLQLSGQLHDGHNELERLHRSHNTGTPPTQELTAYLRSLIQRFQHVYIFLDALDESPRYTHRDEVLDVVTLIQSWSLPGMHLFVTSRDEVDIRNRLNPTTDEEEVMRNNAINQDISNFISAELRTNKALYKWEAYHDKIQKALIERAGGVFRWVECQFQALKSCLRSEKKLMKCLEGLPRDLDETYERMLCNIDEDAVEEARRMLTFLCYSARPLTVPEIIDGIAVSLDEPAHLDRQRRLEGADDLYDLCPGLISIVRPEDSTESDLPTVNIAHFSVQEYLQSDRILAQKSGRFALQGDLAHTEITHISLVYVMELDLSLDMPNVKYPLAHYAAEFWYNHYKDARKQDHLEGAILRLFRQKREKFCAWAILYEHLSPENFPHPASIVEKLGQPLYYASLFGLTRVVQDIIAAESGSGHAIKDLINKRSYCDLTALVVASREGFATIVQILLDNGADANFKSRYGSSAIIAACGRGHERIVQLLLERGAKVNPLGRLQKPALYAASSEGHENIVRLLLDSGADISPISGIYGSALSSASSGGYTSIVQLLLDRGADINAMGDLGTALYVASYHGHESVVRLLLNNGADINAKGRYDTALSVASSRHHKSIVQLLLDRGASVIATGKQSTALYPASDRSHESVVRLFSNNGADINAGAEHDTSLYTASLRGHESMVQLLLENGADVNAMGKQGTALYAASYRGHESVVRLLLNNGADINVWESHYGSALGAASECGHLDIVKLLLESGADVNVWGKRYGSALGRASRYGRVGIVKLLLEKGADPNAPGGYLYNSAIAGATKGGHQDIVELLLDNGATPWSYSVADE
ncbi:ankyrin repeat-containing protein [Arthroderma uncinatum]|uniref:ankyrin repeat-containing protein n=1 Tax=Arthroderma uncinatum TaxID=74035 RepID=UPI00144A5165|nr:ankyrin repeat-containing protein [Arthroderma uncinatum]KAF3482178.1 ankyrin repeat-containing protein [Arthroderma uncinatum]